MSENPIENNITESDKAENKTEDNKIKNNKVKNGLRETLQWVQAIVVAVVISLLIRGFVFEQAMVIGDSMQNTLHDSQRLIVYKLGYHFSPPKRGDIIILQYRKGLFKYQVIPDPKEIDYIKRVIGLPGDEVDIRQGFVYVNKEKLFEPYAKGLTSSYKMKFPVKVPEGSVFVLGDNRQNSKDSREIGFIKLDNIKGKAVFRIMPFADFGNIYK